MSSISKAAQRFSPLFNRVLVQRVQAERKTASGVILPDSAAGAKMNMGVVVRVGPGLTDKSGKVIPPAVSVGDKVLLPEYGGTKVKLDEEEFTLVRDDDLLGLVKEN